MYFASSNYQNSDKQSYKAGKDHQHLGLSLQELKDFGKVRKAYKLQLTKVYRNRVKRVLLNRAYSNACATIFNSKLSDIEVAIINGDLQQLNDLLKKDKQLLNKSINNYPIIYLAVRSGHYDVVEHILRAGCKIDFKGYRSTPMHCAAYYGHYNIIPLLLMYGIPIDIRNQFNALPIQQAANPQIQELLRRSQYNKINHLHKQLHQLEVAVNIINIHNIYTQKKQIVIKKIIHQNYAKFYCREGFDDGFHGTGLQKIISIMKNGLKRPGDTVQGKKLEIVAGHIPLGTNFQGKKDWPRAVFLSPSIYYASHPVYAKQFIDDDNSAWLPLVQAKIKKGSYTRHDHTIGNYNVKNEEPTDLQFRVECKNDEIKDLIMRAQSTQNVIIITALFIKKGFLDNHDSYEEVTSLILDSQQQKQYRQLLQKKKYIQKIKY